MKRLVLAFSICPLFVGCDDLNLGGEHEGSEGAGGTDRGPDEGGFGSSDGGQNGGSDNNGNNSSGNNNQGGDGSDVTGHACDGLHDGTFTGLDYGDVEGTLEGGDALYVTFVSGGSGEAVEGVAHVYPDGSVEGTSQGVTVYGWYDFDRCEADGEWETQWGLFGTWEIAN